jgi:hypothetical protein
MHNRWAEFQVDTEKRIGVSRLHSQATKLKTNMVQVAIRHQRKLEAHTLQQALTLLAAEKARVGYAERDTALLMLHEKQKNRSRRITVGADKAYDTKDFVATAGS